MPLYPTTSPDVVRVVLPAAKSTEAKSNEADIVCFLRVVNERLEISYSHHNIRSRESTMSAYSDENAYRMALTPALEGLISAQVIQEVFNSIQPFVRVYPGEVNQSPAEVF